jgi:hypothetical protein
MNPSTDGPGRMALPHLPSLELGNQTIIQYVTMCTARRRPLLARPEIVSLLIDAWRKAGLVARPEDWPFQGELNTLYWHEA